MSIQVSINISGSVNGLQVGAGFSETLTVAGNNATTLIQNIGTSREAIIAGDVTFPCGLIYIENQSATETLTLSLDSGGTNVIAVIAPGGPPYVGYALAATPYGVFSIAATALVIVSEQ